MRVVTEWDRARPFRPEVDAVNQPERSSSEVENRKGVQKLESLAPSQGVFNGALLGVLLWVGIAVSGFALQSLIFN
jgi:hypothetical protein